ncbi:UNVERIFIED_CONTAM: hypothetical protein PYX00_007443 [Menopon gallinae]|uniref:DNA/RNA non-specific endonuclease/pyrophosphatase/phosphodiesterase domain-containing protein n=1 Tax=Menopon gallinae TaxID=328185 RepID=A0AAW2HJC7_9NEOP
MQVTFLLLFLFWGHVVSGQSECSLRVKNQSDFSIYRKLQWLKPNTSAESDVLSDGETVEVHCETGFLQNQLISKTYNLQCTNGSFNRGLRIDDFLCRSRHQANTTTYRRPCCDQFFGILKCVGKNLIAYEVGHLQPSGCSKLLYTVCVDKSDLRTKFAYQPRLRPPAKKEPRVGCKKGTWGFDEFGQTVEEKKVLSRAYYQKYQKQRLTTLFPDKYGRKKPYPHYFNRGHIVPSGDFPECEQTSTYQHINLAPQWQVLNQGSWNRIEDDTRELVRNSSSEWVGVHRDLRQNPDSERIYVPDTHIRERCIQERACTCANALLEDSVQ